MTSNKYTNPPQTPIIFSATVESIVEDNKKLCDSTRAFLDRLVATIPHKEATFENVLLPIAQAENERQLVFGVLGLYLKVCPDPAMREASAKAQKESSHFTVESSMREDVFRLVDSVFQKNEAVDPESRKLLVEERRNYVRNGLALPSKSDRDRLKEIRKRLSTITTDFSNNLDEEEHMIWFTPAELEGVSEDILSRLESGIGELKGKLKVTLDSPDVSSLMGMASSSKRGKRFRPSE